MIFFLNYIFYMFCLSKSNKLKTIKINQINKKIELTMSTYY